MNLQDQLITAECVFVLVYVVVRLHRKKVKASWEKLIAETITLNSVVVKDVKLSYLIDNGGKYFVSVFNRADIHLFDDFLFVFRQQDLFFLLYFEPLLICKQQDLPNNAPTTIERQTLEEINIERFIKGELEISWADRTHKRSRTTLTLKQLSTEQVKQLSALQTWV